MSLLGAEYDSEESPAPPAQERPGLLAIVDYDAEPDEAQGDGGAAQKLDEMGASLDRMDAESAPRRVGVGAASVQVTVVKKTPPPRDGAEPAAASNGAASASEGGGGGSGSGGDGASGSGGANTSGAGADAPAFVIPDSPPGEVPPKMMEKFLGFAKKTRETGMSVNDYIRNAKRFRNPDLLEMLVGFLDVQEFGTNYPPSAYDPNDHPPEDFYDKLEIARRQWEQRQARKPGERVEFRSSGSSAAAAPSSAAAAVPRPTLPSVALPAASAAAAAAAAMTAAAANGVASAAASAAAAAAGAEASAPPAKRKSKWDTGGDAQRQRN